MINKGYQTADRTIKGDEIFTPFYAVKPILKYLSKDKVIWCPFDEEWSAYVQLFEEEGFKVIRSSLAEGQNFFDYEPKEHYDVIVSNPPFSKKDKVLKRLHELDKPYAMLLPLAVLQGNSRFKYIKDCEWLGFDKRIGFHTNNDFQNYTKGTAFATGYLCKGILPEKLILEQLEEYERELV